MVSWSTKLDLPDLTDDRVILFIRSHCFHQLADNRLQDGCALNGLLYLQLEHTSGLFGMATQPLSQQQVQHGVSRALCVSA